jgi:hypothetical protein
MLRHRFPFLPVLGYRNHTSRLHTIVDLSVIIVHRCGRACHGRNIKLRE